MLNTGSWYSRKTNEARPFQKPHGDSSALALLTQNYADTVGKRHLAVIVDHGLREKSYIEACRVQSQMRSHGVTSDIVSIDGPRPTSGLQEWARLRRYQIFMLVARDRPAGVFFAPHAGG